jgi:hypothetical protein
MYSETSYLGKVTLLYFNKYASCVAAAACGDIFATITPSDFFDMIHLSNAIWMPPGGSSTVHIYTQTIHRTTQITTNWEECGPCPIFASFTLVLTYN